MNRNRLIEKTAPAILFLGATRFIATICLCIALSNASAVAEEQTALFACANQDIKAVSGIEDRGAANDLPDNQLGQAGLMLLQARQDCYHGKVREGVALYDAIIKLAPAN
jgi:hypothetical protein